MKRPLCYTRSVSCCRSLRWEYQTFSYKSEIILSLACFLEDMTVKGIWFKSCHCDTHEASTCLEETVVSA